MTIEALAAELKKELPPQRSGLTDIEVIKKFAKGVTRWDLKYCFNAAKDIVHFKSLINETCERNIRIRNIESKKE